MSLARRGFLRLIAAAPVAAPVIAREAASAAGLNAVGSYGAVQAGYGQPCSGSSDKDWAATYAKRVFSADWRAEKEEEWKWRTVTMLDPDLASSRSMSLSAATIIQRKRNLERHIASERADAKRSFFRAFGFEFKP